MPACTVLGAVGELAASRHGAFTRSQTAEFGLHHRELARLVARGFLWQPAPGVLVVRGSPPTWQQRAYVAAMALHGRGLVIGGGAARQHGVDSFAEHAGILVAGPRGSRVHLPGVTLTQLRHTYDDALDVLVIDGVPCSSLARTIADLARYHPDRYERAADDFQRRNMSLEWLAQTIERVPARRGDGRALLLDDLQRRRSGGTVRGSWFEQMVELCIASPRIPPLARQFSVYDEHGTFLGRPDLAIPSLKMAIEAHSRKFHTGPAAEAFDERRENQLTEVGWQTSYVGWADTSAPATVCRSIERMVATRACDLGLDLVALCRS